VLHHPNYGPYRLLDSDPLSAANPAAPDEEFLRGLESGEEILLSENRVAGLNRQKGPAIRSLLILAALRQYPENEHRLLIVHRAAQLLDDTQGWDYAQPIFRAAVQYLASRPHVALAGEWQNTPPLTEETEEPGNPGVLLNAVEHLISVPFGEEPEEILALVNAGLPTRSLYDILALAGAEMLWRSDFDAHAVTGIHCVLDLLHDSQTPAAVRSLGVVLALSSSRTRRQKESRSRWKGPLVSMPGEPIALETVREALDEDVRGILAGTRAAQYLQNGGNPLNLARTLTEKSLISSNPFDAIHNVKMINGLLVETVRAHTKSLAWRHLAAGARVVASSAAGPGDESEAVLALWRGEILIHGATPQDVL
jgi:hypothetical protein